jgi:NTE family protein
LLVDGGVLNNIPINHAKRYPGDLLIAINVNADIPPYKPTLLKKEVERKKSSYRKKMRDFKNHLQTTIPVSKKESFGYFNLINKTISLMIEHVTLTTINKYPPDILIDISKKSCGTYDFYKAEELFEIGRYSVQKILETHKKELIAEIK